MIKVDSTANIEKLEQAWIKAKEGERQWNAHRLQIEQKIQELVIKETFVEELPKTGTLRLTSLDLAFTKERKFLQPLVAALIKKAPWMLGTLFRTEYKQVSSKVIDEFIASNDPDGIGVELLNTFEDKSRKPTFKRR